MDEYVYTVSRMLDVWMDGLESSSIIIVKTLDNIIVKAFEQQLTVPKLAVSSQRKRIIAASLL